MFSRTQATARRSEAGSMLWVAGSTSTNTGMAPTKGTTSPLEKNVKSGTKTASPSPTPQARRASSRASVPLAQVRQWSTAT